MRPSPAGVAGATDAELVSRVADGDRDALAAIFDRYAGHLLAFCRSIVRNQADADDCLQDVFVVAATRLDGLRQPDRLRSWLFAVARHTCLARIERDGRVLPTDDVADDPGPDADPAARGALDADLAAMVDDAMEGLAPRDRLVLELADRQGLSTDEVAGALGMAAPSAHKVLVRARATARRSLGVALVARSGQGDCPELAAVLGDWDGTLTPLLRKRVSRHLEHCVVCSSEEQRLAAPGALLGAGAVVAVPVGLRAGILRTAGRALGHSTGAGGSGTAGSGGAAGGGRSGHSTAGNSTADDPSVGAVPGSATSAGSTSGSLTAADDWVAGWPPPYDGFGTGRNRRRVAGAVGIIAVVIVAVVLGAVQPWSGGTSVADQATVSHRSAPPAPRTSTAASSTMPPPTAAPTSAPAPSSGTSASAAPKARRSTGSAPPAPTATPAVGPATTIPSPSTAVPPVTPSSTTVPTTVPSSSPTTSSSTTTTTTTTVPPTTTTTTTIPVIQ